MHEATIVLPGGHAGFAIPRLENCYLVVTQQYSPRPGKWALDTRSASSAGFTGVPGDVVTGLRARATEREP
ncbi:hypothetical protein A5791_07690 [Mycobacterium sp. 852002-51163_SCH5372311]|nr:hypothetical protein A5791_07690 [Mycobacterium sp. 852002-51163_SCH5372311]